MSIPRNNPPKAGVLMDSMRSMGYTFEAALADVIDNSISAEAQNVYIEFPKEPIDCYIAICDDGKGMTSEELYEAMKYGSDVQNGIRSSEDLGRFGLGLKAASLSQCRKLTVISKHNTVISAFSWNLDVVCQDEWLILELEQHEILNLHIIHYFDDKDSGTIVLWENFDVIERSTGDVFTTLDEYKEKSASYLSLIYHRYLNEKKISIFINNFKIEGLDPFLENHKKTNIRKEIQVPIQDSNCIERFVTVTPFVLPFQKDLSKEDLVQMGGTVNFRTKQGFYIYRNKRLILWGTWFGIPKNELTKNARVRVDIPNTLDDIWNIDIKKQNATIPKKISNQIRRAVEEAMHIAVKSQKYRGRIVNVDKEYEYIWDRVEDRGKYTYKVNRDSTVFDFLKGIDLEEGIRGRFDLIIDEIEKSIPYQQIYIDMSGNEIAPEDVKLRKDEILLDAIYLLDIYKSMGEKDILDKVDKLFQSEPYCKYPELKMKVLEEV